MGIGPIHITVNQMSWVISEKSCQKKPLLPKNFWLYCSLLGWSHDPNIGPLGVYWTWRVQNVLQQLWIAYCYSVVVTLNTIKIGPISLPKRLKIQKTTSLDSKKYVWLSQDPPLTRQTRKKQTSWTPRGSTFCQICKFFRQI